MTYMEQLKQLKTSTAGTVFTAKRPFDIRDSGDSSHFQKLIENTKPAPEPTADQLSGAKVLIGNTEVGQLHAKKKPVFSDRVPLWCRANCHCLEAIPLPKEGEVVGCVNPSDESWRRLSWMTECRMRGSTP
jgi:hypothetical protein